MMTLPLWKDNVISPGLSPGIAWTSTGSPERFLNMGKVLFKNYRYGVTIDILPDNVLLDIFDFCLRDSTMSQIDVQRPMKWQVLVHICQRWRRITLQSPRRLDLHLSCSYGTPVRRNLGSWPVTLPLAIDYSLSISRRLTSEDEDSMIYALRRVSRVHHIDIRAPRTLLRKVAAVMQKSFPLLTHLDLVNTWDLEGMLPSIPERFLDGSAPNLQYFRLGSASFPQLPTFLLSARNLITLKVEHICQNGYISPEDMVRSLAVLTKLRTLSITLKNTLSPSDQWRIRPDPPMRITLPSLTTFHYEGYSKYLYDFLAQIDTPRVDDLRIGYFTHEIQATQLTRFLDRTEHLKPELDQFNRTRVTIYHDVVTVELDSSAPRGKHRRARLTLEVVNQAWLDMQILCVVEILGQLIPMSSHVEHLDAHGDHVNSRQIADWLPLFRLFPAVKTLHLSGGIAAYIVSALEDTSNSEEMVTDVFPELHLIWSDEMDNKDGDEPVGSIDGFLAMRQLTSFPVTVVDTEDEFYRS
ncbi:hypothetical protein EDB85DRAFT_1507722 [Lactarius pseudohatsudake]|nr:hypothetical protein EDB85DRAFT_1507722 [Lactarius pseudohatsudake]